MTFFVFLGGECEIEVETSPFVETAAMKEKSPQAQGCDAAMEQLIKRSKKGAKIQVFLVTPIWGLILSTEWCVQKLSFTFYLMICYPFQWMEERGWNEEFRCMASNVLVSKKVERDIGGTRTGGVHLRKNLREILAVEELLESEGWLENPETEKLIGQNMDKTTSLNPDIATFWYHCGLNRDKEITSLLSHSVSKTFG